MEISIDNLSRSYDLIVIGSGPAGLTLAHRYDDLTTSNRTLIVESGSRSNQNSEAQELSLVSASGDVDSSNYSVHSQRIFGGTSTVWSGYCKVLETRAFLNGEWPFSYDELQAYYPKAADILGLPGEIYTHPETPFPGNANLVYRPYYITSRRRFDVLFQDWMIQSSSVDVLFNHTVTNIGVQDGQAQYVSIQKSSRKPTPPVKIFGNKIVLAAGGIQNARLLQLSLPRDNALPIGSYFCQHPHIRRSARYGHIILDKDIFDRIKNESASGTSIGHSIALSSEFSNAKSCESVNFLIQPPAPALANLLGRNRRSVVAAIRSVHAEMRPLASNNITLSNTRRDFLDQPIAQVVLRFSLKGIHAAHDYVNAELIRSGIGRLGVPREVKIHEGGGHMIGSTRMGKDPSNSVTDAHARVWGMKNLYLAGSSLFPAAGAANPTFTILALSLRLADHLAGRSK